MNFLGKILHFSYMLAMIIAAFPLNAMEPIKTPSVKLTPEDVLDWNILAHLTEQGIIKISVDGCIAKMKGDLQTAIPLLEEAAQYENVPAIVALAEICDSQGNLLQATKWFVLAFQVDWLNKGGHNPKAKNWLTRLPHLYPELPEGMQRFCTDIANEESGFFSHYPIQESSISTPVQNQTTLSSSFNSAQMKKYVSLTKKKEELEIQQRKADSVSQKISRSETLRKAYTQPTDTQLRTILFIRQIFHPNIFPSNIADHAVLFYFQIDNQFPCHEPYLLPSELKLKLEWKDKICADSPWPSNHPMRNSYEDLMESCANLYYIANRY